MVRQIPVGLSLVALIDDEDFERASAFRWSPRTSNKTTYAICCRRGKTVYLHRLLMDAKPGTLVDHVDGNGLNCQRKSNLRFATQSQQNANQHRKSRQWPFKGIDYHVDRNKWRAKVEVSGRVYRSQYCDSLEQAARDYDDLARTHFGEFARLNFPRIGEGAA